MKNKTTAIIPCCGYGTRMNTPKDKSKELILSDGAPLISYHIELCKDFDLDPIFLVRPEKKDLLSFLSGQKVIEYTPGKNKEWTDTIYENRSHYSEKNILLLPDTQFEPRETVANVKSLLQKSDLVFATHEVSDPKKWGYVDQEQNRVYEKYSCMGSSGRAWGIIGFDFSEVGMFKSLAEEACYDFKGKIVHEVYMTKFEDKTRG